uniref:HT018 n=1 Tax=Homo sapiens TaxID=9606 RepID=Q9HBL2_HUMAN|nr:HT018 [Homo sapiens]
MRQLENAGQHHTLQFTLPSSCANWNHPLAVLRNGPQCCCGCVKSPFILKSSLLPLDYFNTVISLFASRKGTNVPIPLFCCVPLAQRSKAVRGWAETWEESPSPIHSTQRQCTQRNDMEIDAGRLVPAVINENSKYKADHNGCCKNVDWGKGFFILFFILLIMFLGDGRWCVFFSSWFSFAQAHKRDFCLLYHEQRNCPHTVNHEQCCCCFFKQYIWWSLCLLLFPVRSSGFSFVFKKNSKKD